VTRRFRVETALDAWTIGAASQVGGPNPPWEHIGNEIHTASRIQYQQVTRATSPVALPRETGREIRRCLARYVARDLYRLLDNGAPAA
jgi:hypothetical protein